MTFKELFKLSLKGYIGLVLPIVLISSIVILVRGDAIEFNDEKVFGIKAVLILIPFNAFFILVYSLFPGFILYAGNKVYNLLFKRFEK
jgi:hypothetical protein